MNSIKKKIMGIPYVIWFYPIVMTIMASLISTYVLLFSVYDIKQNSNVLDRINNLSSSNDALKDTLDNFDTSLLRRETLRASYLTLHDVQEVSDIISDITLSFDSSRFKITSKTSAPAPDANFKDLNQMKIKLNVNNLVYDDKSLMLFNSSINRLNKYPKRNDITKIRVIGHNGHIKSFEVTFVFWVSKVLK